MKILIGGDAEMQAQSLPTFLFQDFGAVVWELSTILWRPQRIAQNGPQSRMLLLIIVGSI
jgi:hypothetical protein